MKAFPDTSRENLCNRCGVCCMAALRVNGTVVAIRELACRYLREARGGRFTCAVYEHRFETAPWCLMIPQALPEGVLAPDCGYRVGQPAPDLSDEALAKSDAPVRLNSKLVRLIAPHIRAAFAGPGWPVWVDESTLPVWLRDPPAD